MADNETEILIDEKEIDEKEKLMEHFRRKQRERTNRWRAANQDKIRERNKSYYYRIGKARAKEKLKELKKDPEWRKKNCEYKKRYLENNETARKKQRALYVTYYWKNREKVLERRREAYRNKRDRLLGLKKEGEQ
jgi:hypothetical protein